MARRISPGGERKNIFGPRLKSVRLSKGISATEMVARLGVLGWEVANSSLSQIESGSRILGDRELLLILKVLGLKLSDLESGKR